MLLLDDEAVLFGQISCQISKCKKMQDYFLLPITYSCSACFNWPLDFGTSWYEHGLFHSCDFCCHPFFWCFCTRPVSVPLLCPQSAEHGKLVKYMHFMGVIRLGSYIASLVRYQTRQSDGQQKHQSFLHHAWLGKKTRLFLAFCNGTWLIILYQASWYVFLLVFWQWDHQFFS